MPEPLSRTERKKSRTRERLYQAAVQLIATKGYEAATMDEIAEAADTARGTAFNHFPSKRYFVFEWAARRREQAESATLPLTRDGLSITEQLHAYFHELAKSTADEPELTRTMLVGWVHAGGPIEEDSWLVEELISFLESGQQRGTFPLASTPLEAAWLLYDAYIGLLLRWIQNPDRWSRSELIAVLDERIDNVLYGIIDLGAKQ